MFPTVRKHKHSKFRFNSNISFLHHPCYRHVILGHCCGTPGLLIITKASMLEFWNRKCRKVNVLCCWCDIVSYVCSNINLVKSGSVPSTKSTKFNVYKNDEMNDMMELDRWEHDNWNCYKSSKTISSMSTHTLIGLFKPWSSI